MTEEDYLYIQGMELENLIYQHKNNLKDREILQQNHSDKNNQDHNQMDLRRDSIHQEGKHVAWVLLKQHHNNIQLHKEYNSKCP